MSLCVVGGLPRLHLDKNSPQAGSPYLLNSRRDCMQEEPSQGGHLMGDLQGSLQLARRDCARPQIIRASECGSTCSMALGRWLSLVPGVIAAAACGVVCGAWGGGPSTWRPLAPKIPTFARAPGAISASNSRIARPFSTRVCCAPAPALHSGAWSSGSTRKVAACRRELVATRPIACSEVLAFVPRHCQLDFSWRVRRASAPARRR